MKSSVLALALFFFLCAIAAKPSSAARHEPSLLLPSDCKEVAPNNNCHIISALRGVLQDGLNQIMSSSFCPAKKTSWPELVGENGEEAAVVIEKEEPTVRAIVVLEGSPGTQDYRCHRVRVVVNKKGKVVVVPRIG